MQPGTKRSPYVNPDLSAGDNAIIVFELSKYHGVRGQVLEIEESGGYALFDIPVGTKLRVEGRDSNAVPVRTFRDPKIKQRGEPQWFPKGWLKRTEENFDPGF